LSYPIDLNLTDKTCVVVGGGEVASRKVHGLLEAGARVVIISPKLTLELQQLSNAQKIEWREGKYQRGVLKSLKPLLVFAATDDSKVNQEVAAEAREIGALVNVADSGESGDFANMSTIQRGRITIAVSTGGASPLMAKLLVWEINKHIGAEYVQLADLLAEKRSIVRSKVDTQAERQAVWQRLLESPVLELLRQGDLAGATAMLESLL
jgi:precorrin-2 dehydrogenase/sirohydrochlorin ferrochelatase